MLTVAAEPEFESICAALALEILPLDDAALTAEMSKQFEKWKMLAELALKEG